MSESWHIRAALRIHHLFTICNEAYDKGKMFSQDITDLANLRDYYMYRVLDASKEVAPSLLRTLNLLENKMTEWHDDFHAGFFFTLSQILSLKYEIPMLPGELVKRIEFEQSWTETKKRLELDWDREIVR